MLHNIRVKTLNVVIINLFRFILLIISISFNLLKARLDLGTDNFGYGYGGTGKKSNAKNFEDYGTAYGKNDVIGMCSMMITFIYSYTQSEVSI